MNTKRGQRLLELAVIFFWASEYCHAPYFTPYLSSLEIAATLSGIIVACYGFTQMVLRIPLGILTDATGAYKTVIVSGLVLTTVSSLGLYLTTNTVLILLCRVLAGAASSTWIATTVVYMLYFPPQQSVTATARLNALNNGGKLLAFILGGIAAAWLGYRVTLFMSFAAGLVGLMFALCTERATIRRAPVSLQKLCSLLFRRSVLIPALLMAVQQMVMQATVFSFTSTIAADLGAATWMLSLLSIVVTLVQIPAVKLIASPRIAGAAPGRVVAGGFFLLSGYLLILGLAPNVWLILLGQVAVAFGSALLNSILLAECVRGVPSGERSTVVGIYQAVYGIGMTAGPMWMGWLLDRASRAVSCGIFAAFVGLTGLLVLLCWKNRATATEK